MNKKFYVTPEMEIENVELERCMLLANSSGDPNWTDDEYSGDMPEDPDA